MTTTFVDPHYAYGTATVANAATLGQNEINITLLWREFQYRHAQNRVRRGHRQLLALHLLETGDDWKLDTSMHPSDQHPKHISVERYEPPLNVHTLEGESCRIHDGEPRHPF